MRSALFANNLQKIVLTFFFIVSGVHISSAYTSPGSATGFVNDFAVVLSPTVKQTLASELTAFTASTTHEITIVTVKSVGTDETIESYAVKLFEEWKIGKKGEDNGILFLIAADDHKARIEVGYGLEGALPDLVANNILQKEVLPKFKTGDYDGGVTSGVHAIMNVTQNEPGSKEKYSGGQVSSNSISADSLQVFFVIIVVVFGVIGNILASSKRWWVGGVGGAIIGATAGYFFFALVGAVVTGVVLGLLGLLLDFILSRHGPFQGGGGHGGTSSFILGSILGGRGGNGGGSSFGGFGGGRSGGGGASGSW